MSTAEGWARLGGVEIFSNIRTLQYVRRNLENVIPEITVGLDPNYTPPRNTADEDQLACFCFPLGGERTGNDSVYDPEPTGGFFDSPLNDPAPWVTANPVTPGVYPTGALEYLGLYVTRHEIQPALSRTTAQRSTGGAVLGALRKGGPIVVIEGFLFATDTCGLEYGERWLTDILATNGSLGCDACELGDYCYLPCCPPSGLVADADFRTLKQVGIVAGPEFECLPGSDPRACYIRPVTFQLQAEIPYRFMDEEVCASEPLPIAPPPPNGLLLGGIL